jgi:hypothetical protein
MITVPYLEEMAYLGLACAFSKRLSEGDLRHAAARCIAGRQANRNMWIQSGGSTPVSSLCSDSSTTRVLEDSKGVLLLAFHVGPYFWIPHAIANTGRRVALLVDDGNHQQARRTDVAWTTRCLPYVTYISTADPLCAFRVRQLLHSGCAVVAFLDGNTGMGNVSSNNSSLVRVGTAEFTVRNGVVRVAAMARVPVLYARASIDATGIDLEVSQAGSTREDEGPRAFAERVTQNVYTQFAALMNENPSVWEEWPHVPGWLSKAVTSRFLKAHYQLALRVDSCKIAAVRLDARPALINLGNGSAVEASDLVRDVLDHFKAARSVADVIDNVGAKHSAIVVKQVIDELYSTGFLVADE